MVRRTNHRPGRRKICGIATLEIITENKDMHYGKKGKDFKVNPNKLKSWQQKKGDEE